MTNELPVPPVAEMAPTDAILTKYDEQHLTTYLRLLDAEDAQADWEEAAQIVLKLDTKADKPKARLTWESHLARAHWLTNNGYRLLVRGVLDH
jgi:hypothetical protein